MIEDLWYKNAAFYSLDVETFADGNGDGVGDFVGLTDRLDYLHSLGIDVLWLGPFQPSPQRDNGYDVSDHYGVDPRYGSPGDLVEFMHQARRRGIKVVMDLVVNHTSVDHRWFQEARSDPDSPFHDWYIWSKKRPKDWNEGMVFPGVQESTWTYDRKAKAYYYHRFYEHQPDLNMDNPNVRREVRRIMGFWLELGVAGFRVDAVPFVIESTVPGKSQGIHHFDYLTAMRQFLQWRVGDAVLLGEANVLPKETKEYFGAGSGSGLHMMFNFFVNQHLFYALATSDIGPLKQALDATRGIPETGQWAQFLRNHDELDLGRLTDDQRKGVFERFGPEAQMQLYDRGIRRRLAPMLGDRRHIELAYSLMFSLPGSPVLYYGEEIGMGDDLSLKEREAVRTPMQWSDAPNAGFTACDDPVAPVIDQGVYSYRHINVEAQRHDKDSLLNWMAGMLRTRKESPEIGWGDWKMLDPACPTALAMHYRWDDRTLITVHNFDERPHEMRLEIEDKGTLVDQISGARYAIPENGRVHFPLEAQGYAWFRVDDFTLR